MSGRHLQIKVWSTSMKRVLRAGLFACAWNRVVYWSLYHMLTQCFWLLLFRKSIPQIYACWLLILLGKALKCWTAWTGIFIKISKPTKISRKKHLWGIKKPNYQKTFTNTVHKGTRNFISIIISLHLSSHNNWQIKLKPPLTP